MTFTDALNEYLEARESYKAMFSRNAEFGYNELAANKANEYHDAADKLNEFVKGAANV